MKKNKFSEKPASCRLFLSLAVLLIFLNIFPDETDSIINRIGSNYEFDYIKIFFRKEIKDFSGGRMGLISGKMEESGDTLKAYIIMNDTSFSYIYAAGYLEEYIEGRMVSRKRSEGVPLSLNIKAALNPLAGLPEETKLSYVQDMGIKAVWENDPLKESALFYMSQDMLIDSIKVMKGGIMAMKSVYAYNADRFPVKIINFDYERKIEEHILNYNIKFKRNIDFGTK